jgi:hypothetical protein
MTEVASSLREREICCDAAVLSTIEAGSLGEFRSAA